MNVIRLVLPQPVSPIRMTGMLHLWIEKKKFNYSFCRKKNIFKNYKKKGKNTKKNKDKLDSRKDGQYLLHIVYCQLIAGIWVECDVTASQQYSVQDGQLQIPTIEKCNRAVYQNIDILLECFAKNALSIWFVG